MSVVIKTLKTVLGHVQKVVPEAECRRAYLAEQNLVDLAAMTKPLVTIIPNDRGAELATRGGVVKSNITVDIGVQRKLTHVGDMERLTEEIDPLIGIVERIFNEFLTKIILGDDSFRVVCHKPKHFPAVPMYDPDEISENQCFLGIVQIEVEVHHNGNQAQSG